MRWLERGSKSMGALFAGIRVRLFGMILLAVLPLVAVSGFELKQERQRNIEAAHANAVEIARRSADLYDRSILEARILLEAVADFGNFACDHAAAMLRWAGFARCEAGRALWVIGPDGSVVCANSRGGIDLNMADRPYFRRALTERTFVVSDFIIGRLQRVPTSLAILPVLDKDGAVVRLIAVSLRLSWFSRLAADVGKGTEALVLLFDGKGSLLARYPKKTEWIGTNWRGYPLATKMAETEEGWADIVSLVGPPRWLTAS